MKVSIIRLDHFVLTVRDIEKTIAFYTQVLGMQLETFGQNRKALIFGQQKINLHLFGKEFEPKAKQPTPCSADLCLITDISINEVIKIFKALNISIEEGPIQRTGAIGPITSVYIRDPDSNLIEISNYQIM